MTTDTSERGLERLICTALTGAPCDPGSIPAGSAHERHPAGGAGWVGGSPENYDREYCVDLVQLSAFLKKTQPDVVDALELSQDGPTRRKFLARLQGYLDLAPTLRERVADIDYVDLRFDDRIYVRPTKGSGSTKSGSTKSEVRRKK